MESKAGGEAGVSVRNFFPTPIATVDIRDAAAINAELRHIITEREKTTPSVEFSNLGGWQSPWDFQSWCGETGLGIIGLAIKVANKFTCDRGGRPVDIDWKINSWANINRTKHGNALHTHPGSYWSASYYVDDGGIADDPSLGGEFEIRDPRGVAPAMYAPRLAFALPDGRSVGGSELIRPRAGTMLVFPSWLAHGVRPYHGSETRISVAMNLFL